MEGTKLTPIISCGNPPYALDTGCFNAALHRLPDDFLIQAIDDYLQDTIHSRWEFGFHLLPDRGAESRVGGGAQKFVSGARFTSTSDDPTRERQHYPFDAP